MYYSEDVVTNNVLREIIWLKIQSEFFLAWTRNNKRERKRQLYFFYFIFFFFFLSLLFYFFILNCYVNQKRREGAIFSPNHNILLLFSFQYNRPQTFSMRHKEIKRNSCNVLSKTIPASFNFLPLVAKLTTSEDCFFKDLGQVIKW